MDDGLGCGRASVWSPAQPLLPAVPWAWPRVPEPASSTAGEAESGLGPRHRRAAVSRRGTHRCPRPLRAAPPAADGERGRGRLAAAQVQAQGPRPPRGPGPQRCGSRCAPGQQVRHGKREGGCPGGLPGRAEGGGCSQLTHLWVRSARERAIRDMQTGSPARWGPPAAPHDHGAPGLWPPAFLRVPPPPPLSVGSCSTGQSGGHLLVQGVPRLDSASALGLTVPTFRTTRLHSAPPARAESLGHRLPSRPARASRPPSQSPTRSRPQQPCP